MPTTLSPDATLLDLAAAHHPAAYASALDQISQTVHQLLLAALERSGPRPAAVPAVLPPPLAPHKETPGRPKSPCPPRGAGWAQPGPGGAHKLSSREFEVLRRLAAGDSNKMIARALDLSPHTVKRHVANILDKLDLRSRGQAAAWWLTQHPRALDD